MLPDHILINILRYLPLEEQIRIGEIDQIFKSVLPLVLVKTTKIVISDESPLQNLDVDTLWNLMCYCESNIKEIEIRSNDALVDTFVQFMCTKLEKLTIDTNYEVDYFDQAMTNNRNLKIIIWKDQRDRSCLVPQNGAYLNLESLEIRKANDVTFDSLTGRCPNLIELKIDLITDILSASPLNAFFASCPRLNRFEIKNCHVSTFRYASPSMVNFRNLHSLRFLTLNNYPIRFDDVDLAQISGSFTGLERLELAHVDLSDTGVSSLASLRQLKSLFLIKINEIGDVDYRLLRQCVNMRMLHLDTEIESATLIALFGESTRLCYLSVKNLTNVDTFEKAITVIQSIGASIHREVAIRIVSGQEIWKSNQVKAALLELKEMGIVIKIVCG